MVHWLKRALLTVCGVILFATLVSEEMGWVIRRTLTAEGRSHEGPAARGLGFGAAHVFVVVTLGYVVCALIATLDRPGISLRRLVAFHGGVIIATLVTLLFSIGAAAIITPVTALLLYVALRFVQGGRSAPAV